MHLRRSFLLSTLLLLLFASSASAQLIGLGASGMWRQSSGSVDGSEQRLTPFLFGVLPKIGSLRLEWAPSALVRQGDTIDESTKVNRYGARLGFNAGKLLGESYLLLSWNRVTVLDDGYAGDSQWNEWGLGVGGIWPLTVNLALFIEAEHVWSSDEREQNPVEEISIDRRGWQMQLGFVAFVY